jgi:hypothetical protein
MTSTQAQDLTDAQLFRVPMSFLRKNTRFTAVAEKNNRMVIVTGVTDMDGHMVSDRYGHRVGNHYFTVEHPDMAYINVKLDGVEYASMHPNTTMRYSDGWVFYVDRAACKQYDLDRTWKPETAEDAARQAKKEELQRQLDSIKRQLDEL